MDPTDIGFASVTFPPKGAREGTILVEAMSGTAIGPFPKALLLLMYNAPLLNVVPRLNVLSPSRVTVDSLKLDSIGFTRPIVREEPGPSVRLDMTVRLPPFTPVN